MIDECCRIREKNAEKEQSGELGYELQPLQPQVYTSKGGHLSGFRVRDYSILEGSDRFYRVMGEEQMREVVGGVGVVSDQIFKGIFIHSTLST